MSVTDEAIKRKSVGGAISYTARTGLVYLIALVATGLLSAYLSPAEFGVFFIVTAIISFFSFMSDVGLAATLVQKKEEPTLIELRTTFTVQQILALVIFLLIVILTPVWQTQTKLNQEGIWLLYALGFSFFLASLKTIPSILLERKLEFQKLAFPQVIEQLVFYAVVVALAYTHHGVSSFTFGVLARGITGLIVMYSLKRWPIGISLNQQALRGLLKFGVKFQLNDLLARLKDDLYFIVLAKFLPVTYMGYLGWAKRWSMFPYQFSVQNIIAVTFPTFARVQEDKQKVARGLEISVYFISLVIFPILIGMMVLAYPLTVAIPSYEKWQPALPALYFFCLNIAFAAVANPFISALNSMGKINITLKMMSIMTLMTWVLTPLMVRQVGYTGVAVISCVTAAFSLYGYLMVKRIVTIKLWSQISWPAGISLVMGSVLLMLQVWIQPSLFIIGLECFLGGAIYLTGIVGGTRKQLRENLKIILPNQKIPLLG